MSPAMLYGSLSDSHRGISSSCVVRKLKESKKKPPRAQLYYTVKTLNTTTQCTSTYWIGNSILCTSYTKTHSRGLLHRVLLRNKPSNF